MKAIKALQEAQARIETLEAEKTQMQTDLTALTARVTALEAG
jgi:prefoldin subunit 5